MQRSRISRALALCVVVPFAALAATSALADDDSKEGGALKGAAKGAAAGAVLPGVSAKTGATVGAVSGAVKKGQDDNKDEK